MERAELRSLVLATGCAEERGGFVFLCDPKWTAAQRAQFEALKSKIGNRRAKVFSGWLCVPTGGTSGGVKFARHDERTLSAAVRGFGRHFGLKCVNAVGVLPAHHVSGLMARVRCAATGGKYLGCEWKKLEAGDTPRLKGGPWVISLVPTQMQRLLRTRATVAWLRKFEIIFLGGGPVWPALADEAAAARLRVSLSYGMTETAAMVAALRPEEFLAGARSSGPALPHAQLAIARGGRIRVTGNSVFRGYFPERKSARTWLTEDLGRIDACRHLHVLGRRDAVIITGGKKVFPTEVEAALRASREFADVAVLGVPDREWGEAVVACYPCRAARPDMARAVAALAPHQRPKRFVALADWPRNAQGKVNRAALAAAVLAQRA
ncbi:MAG: AMP-binding protein [Verrucomicrobia bacterium]|nr:AMP-binding protein [Verrucomicrobiota bacterium]